ncbi:MAG: hypothetical protein KAW19_06975 [Candidatus Aminicenantes bacterium]|nr:hypothetical protein [Candidatus Aminicenantes bacterium]
MLNQTFKALLKEAQFTNEMLGSGATQIRKANYATKGMYFQAFTSLSTGLERIGKLCLMLDYYIDNNGKFPDLDYLKKKIGHKILVLYQKSIGIINERSISLNFLNNLDGNIHRNILKILSNFAQGDRYSNIDILVNAQQNRDPINSWFSFVDRPIFDTCVSDKKKRSISQNASLINQLAGSFSSVLHISETGSLITDLDDASYRTGMQKAVSPYRQLYVLQIIRFWVELLGELHYEAMKLGKQEIPFFNEIFATFYNDDRYFKSRKTWDRI